MVLIKNTIASNGLCTKLSTTKLNKMMMIVIIIIIIIIIIIRAIIIAMIIIIITKIKVLVNTDTIKLVFDLLLAFLHVLKWFTVFTFLTAGAEKAKVI